MPKPGLRVSQLYNRERWAPIRLGKGPRNVKNSQRNLSPMPIHHA